MESYNQSVCHNCLMQGCRGHNCTADDRDIHEAIPSVMSVLHENPELQQGLLDAAADTTSAAVVAPLTFGTYFTLSGDAGIDSDADNPHSAETRHRTLNSYFSDEEDSASSPSGARKSNMKRETARNTIQKKNFHFLWTHSSCLPSLTPGSSCVTKRATKSQSHPRLSVMSPLMASTPTAISSGPCTIPPMNPLRGSKVRFARRIGKSKIQWTLTNG